MTAKRDWTSRRGFTGSAAGRGAANGPMAEAVSHSLQYLAPRDLNALVAYLRTVKAKSGSPSSPADAFGESCPSQVLRARFICRWPGIMSRTPMLS